MSKIEIDEELRRKMFFEIRVLEGENLKTKKLSDKDMVNRIIRIIQKLAKEDEND